MQLRDLRKISSFDYREEDQNVKNGEGAESPSTMKNGGLEDGEKSSEENNAMLLPLIHPLDAKQMFMPSGKPFFDSPLLS